MIRKRHPGSKDSGNNKIEDTTDDIGQDDIRQFTVTGKTPYTSVKLKSPIYENTADRIRNDHFIINAQIYFRNTQKTEIKS